MIPSGKCHSPTFPPPLTALSVDIASQGGKSNSLYAPTTYTVSEAHLAQQGECMSTTACACLLAINQPLTENETSEKGAW